MGVGNTIAKILIIINIGECVTTQRDRRSNKVTEVPGEDCHAYGLFSIEHHVMVECIICTNIQQLLEAKWRRRKQDHIVSIVQVVNATQVVTAITTPNKVTGQLISVHIEQKRR